MERKSLIGKSLDALKNLAAKLKVMGRSRMTKDELVDSIMQASRKASDRIVEAVRGRKSAKPASRKTRPSERAQSSEDDTTPATRRPATKSRALRPAAPPHTLPRDVAKSTAGRRTPTPAPTRKPTSPAKTSKVARTSTPAGGAVTGQHPSAGGLAAFAPPIPELPGTYGHDRIVLMSRDPLWLFAYWEATVASREKARSQINDPKARLALRLYDVTGIEFDGQNANRLQDTPVPDQTVGNWYLNVWDQDGSYVVDIGYLASDGRFVTVARSNVIRTPRASLSTRVDQAWMTVDADYAKIFQLDAGGPHSLSSGQVRERLARKIEQQLSSPSVTSFSSPAQAPGGERPEKHDFWLDVRTELIVYGATDPSAAVEVCGQKIDLRPDGTFSMRFALPDGKQEIQVQARSVRREQRTITPIVEKRTS